MKRNNSKALTLLLKKLAQLNKQWVIYPTLFWLGLVILVSDCSHTTPYYRSDVKEFPKVDVSENELSARLLFIGDAGAPQKREPVLLKMKEWVEKAPEKTTAIFLGDNIYPAGMPPQSDPWRQEAEKRLKAQLAVVKSTAAEAIFIAGNHDWSHGDADGLAALKRQENFINQSHGSGSKLLPSAGCPGPVAIDSKGIRIIALDSHWWFEDNLKPDTSCQQTSKDEVALKLKELVNDADARRVVVVAHHPLLTYGPHGGFYDWKDHLFPLTNIAEWLWIPMPIIGSLYPLTRAWLVRSDQDLSGAKNKAMVRALKEVLSTGEVLIYAAGHEHTLQVLEGGQVVDYLLVSGAGSEVKTTSVGHGDVTLFAHLHTGFMAVDFLAEGRVLLSVIEPGEKEIVFRKWLKE